MLLIYKGQTNNVALTLKEKTTLTTPFYLFSLINDSTKEEKLFLASDISSFKDRYNEFVIEENSTEDLLSGKVKLTLEGFYTYRIYEQESSTNVNKSLTGNLVEVGKALIFGEENLTEAYEGQAKTTKAYQK